MAHSSDSRKKFLEILAVTPFINYACKKVGISRATIYRWMKDNERFRRQVLKALDNGFENLVEVAESVIMNKIRGGDLNAAKFFLTHNSNRYRTKAPIEEALSEKPIASAFVGPDGRVLVSKQTSNVLKRKHEDEWRRRNRAMGFPDPEGPIG